MTHGRIGMLWELQARERVYAEWLEQLDKQRDELARRLMLTRKELLTLETGNR